MKSSRLLIAYALIFSGMAQLSVGFADTAASPFSSEEPAELTVDPQGIAIDYSPTVRDPIRGERSY